MIDREAVRRAAKRLHEFGQAHGWAGPHFKKSFEEFEATDPIGFDEWLALTYDVLAAARDHR